MLKSKIPRYQRPTTQISKWDLFLSLLTLDLGVRPYLLVPLLGIDQSKMPRELRKNLCPQLEKLSVGYQDIE